MQICKPTGFHALSALWRFVLAINNLERVLLNWLRKTGEEDYGDLPPRVKLNLLFKVGHLKRLTDSIALQPLKHCPCKVDARRQFCWSEICRKLTRRYRTAV